MPAARYMKIDHPRAGNLPCPEKTAWRMKHATVPVPGMDCLLSKPSPDAVFLYNSCVHNNNTHTTYRPVARRGPGFFCVVSDKQPDQQTRHHRHSKIHQTCHIPCTWIKTAPPRHIHTLAMPEHFNPAIFCLGVFTRNEERTTGYRSVSPVSGKKLNEKQQKSLISIPYNTFSLKNRLYNTAKHNISSHYESIT